MYITRRLPEIFCAAPAGDGGAWWGEPIGRIGRGPRYFEISDGASVLAYFRAV